MKRKYFAISFYAIRRRVFGKKAGRRKTNRREYIRISTVLPVEFFVLGADSQKSTPWLQGFTCDIGRGGIRLVVNDLWWGFWKKICAPNAQLFLKVDFPFRRKPVFLKAKPSWFKKEDLGDFNQYSVGLEFLEGNRSSEAFLLRYAIVKKATPLAVACFIVVLGLFAFSLSKKADFLSRANRRLVSGYVQILSEKNSLEAVLAESKKDSLFFQNRRKDLEPKIAELSRQVSQEQAKYDRLPPEPSDGIIVSEESSRLKKEIVLLTLELTALKREDEFLKIKEEKEKAVEEKIQNEVDTLEKERVEFSGRIIEGMYDWIKNRQDLFRGLVLSYEGDRNLEKVCFTYDQALAATVFTASGDTDRAKKVLDFYLERIRKGQDIYNAYFTRGDVFEYVVQSGPNAWIGLAALNYVKATGHKKYLKIAAKVSSFLFSMMDKEGGVRGGVRDFWYSTEHNLDVFAFFNLYYELTGQKKYRTAATKVKDWIRRYSYTSYGPPVKRGKGDPTIATDTYAWSVTAIGPQELYALKMNPERILEFTIEHCEVAVDFKRKQGEIRLSGFDFAKAKNLARGGVVSGEWTAQMVLAFEIMANYFKDKDPAKSRQYLKKADFYFSELQKMLNTSLSRAGREDPCLPYASVPFADTGHGWRTPKGNTTGSLAATAYFLLAYHGYNPLRAEFLELSLERQYEEELNRLKVALSR